MRFNALGGSSRVSNQLYIGARPSQLSCWPPLTIDHLVAQDLQNLS